jgi:DNA-binding CsgD family transcriptional regulator
MTAPAKSDLVQFDELQKALRLALELRELPRGSDAQKLHALEGLIALVGAQVGVWLEFDGAATVRRTIDFGWSSDAERAAFVQYFDHDQRVMDPSIPRLARSITGPICTFTRDQLVDHGSWYGSEHVQRFRRGAGVDNYIYTMYVASPDSIMSLALHRPWGDRPFTERERRLVDVFHRECTFLHASPAELAPEILRGLAPRLRDTLRGLARGCSEKQVAAGLGLSPHTVHEYVKALHRHFGVQSRSELLARCLATR